MKSPPLTSREGIFIYIIFYCQNFRNLQLLNAITFKSLF